MTWWDLRPPCQANVVPKPQMQKLRSREATCRESQSFVGAELGLELGEADAKAQVLSIREKNRAWDLKAIGKVLEANWHFSTPGTNLPPSALLTPTPRVGGSLAAFEGDPKGQGAGGSSQLSSFPPLLSRDIRACPALSLLPRRPSCSCSPGHIPGCFLIPMSGGHGCFPPP